MHLIVCATKRDLTVPDILPDELDYRKPTAVAAPAPVADAFGGLGGNDMGMGMGLGGGMAPKATPMAVPVAMAVPEPTPAPAPAVAPTPVSVDDAFAGMSAPEPVLAPAPAPAPAPVPGTVPTFGLKPTDTNGLAAFVES